jgi:hypothetical protein
MTVNRYTNLKWESCCRGRRSACPEVALDNDKIYIKDDDGHIISLTALQLLEVKWKAEKLLADKDK